MALSIFRIKRWWRMLTGNSIDHVNQGIGKCYSLDSLSGYYNDLTEKVTKAPLLLENYDLPKMKLANGELVDFPTAIFQYGLGAYDLFLLTGERKFLKKFFHAVDWAVNHQEPSGAWNNFHYIFPDHPYCGMAQGEGCSLLCRAFKYTNEEMYLNCAVKAIEFMLLSSDKGGTTSYKDCMTILEYTHLPLVLNGWIFAIWGLYDINKVCVVPKYQTAYNNSISSLLKNLKLFDAGYWSYYDCGGLISSPFYHRLHIAQMNVLYEQTKNVLFLEYARKWEKESKNIIFSCVAFIKKAIQKIKE